MDGQVVFFTPRGKALFGAPPRPRDRADPDSAGRDLAVEEESELGPKLAMEESPGAESAAPHQLKPYHRSGAARWKRDSDIPWKVEAQAWEALEAG
jgi:hypothetical protein